jgi:type VI secretion system secreted protein VgrG
VKEPDVLEEEEEEEELSEGITLRVGLFFDGTGNNQRNAAATEQCRAEDLSRYTVSELNEIDALCKRYGFSDFDGSAYNSGPNNSYGNAPSNVVHLYRLYPDNSATPISDEAEMSYVKVYVEGIGTRSGGPDARLYGQGLGQGKTGVIARVSQSPKSLELQLRALCDQNPGIVIERIEFDIFGFSRGAAAARHCANELLKPGRGVFGPLLKAGQSGLSQRFDVVQDVCINLIGLFDTVAAISDPLRGDFSPADDSNYGVNLYLPPDCARRVIQLHARDEYRLNFSLNGLDSSHIQIELPGAHSDVGGGYRLRTKEYVWLTHPVRVTIPERETVESQREWAIAKREAQAFRELDIAREGHIEVRAWPIPTPLRGRHETTMRDYWITAVLSRTVRGELSLIALRVMRELGVRQGVPFEAISNSDSRFQLPDELEPIAQSILQQVLADKVVSLEPEQERLLRIRYIHQSAHCTPDGPFLLSKPAPMKRRFMHLDFPQKGYPQ